MMSKSLILAQTLIFVLFVAQGNLFRINPLFIGIEVLGLTIGLWSLWCMRRHFNMFPELRENAKLLTSGPYAYVRNPMYLSVLIILFPSAFLPLQPILAGAYLTLIAVFIKKVRIEEVELGQRFPEFETYKGKVKAIIPWVI